MFILHGDQAISKWPLLKVLSTIVALTFFFLQLWPGLPKDLNFIVMALVTSTVTGMDGNECGNVSGGRDEGWRSDKAAGERAEASRGRCRQNERRSATSMGRTAGVGKHTKRMNKREREYRRYRRSGGAWRKGWVMVVAEGVGGTGGRPEDRQDRLAGRQILWGNRSVGGGGEVRGSRVQKDSAWRQRPLWRTGAENGRQWGEGARSVRSGRPLDRKTNSVEELKCGWRRGSKGRAGREARVLADPFSASMKSG